MCPAPLKQREFPAWLKNEGYIPHGTPTAEMMEGMGGTIDSGSQPGSRRGSVLTPQQQQQAPTTPSAPGESDFHEPPVSADGSTRRNSIAEYQVIPMYIINVSKRVLGDFNLEAPHSVTYVRV